jgi:hypothetical protein
MADPYALPKFISGPRLIDGTDLQQLEAALGIQTLIMPVPALSGLANSQVRKLAVPFPFIVVTAGFRVADPVTTGSKLATLTTQISGVALTGGVISLTSAAATPSGALMAGTSITGKNTGVSGATLEIAVSAVTAFAEGSGWVEFKVKHL